MSYKVERLSGHWFSEGYRFATREDAEAYAESLPTMDPRRIVKTDGELANYRFKDGCLVPGVAKGSITWEEYLLAGGIV